MPQFFLPDRQRERAFLNGHLHTEDGYKIRTVSAVNSTVLAAIAFTVTSIVAGGVTSVTIGGNGALNTGISLSVPTTATDTVTTVALKLANAIRTNQVGSFYNVTVAAAQVIVTAKLPGPDYNFTGNITPTVANNTGLTVNSSTVSTALVNDIQPGRLLSYASTSFTNQNSASVPRVTLFTGVASTMGMSIHSNELWVRDNNDLVFPSEYPFAALTEGIVSLDVVQGNITPIALGGSVFASNAGVNQGRVAATAIDASYVQINLPGQPFTLRPVSGFTNHGGSGTQKFRLIVEQ